MSKQAYIETELGLLPSDWNIDTLGEMFRPFTSASFSREEMNAQSGIACVHYGDIHKRFGSIVDLDSEKLPLISVEKAHAYKLLKDGDLLLADASEDDEGIGKSIVVIVGNHKAIAGLHTIPLRPRKDLDTRFPSYLFTGKLVKRQIEKLSEGTKVNSISFAKIKDVFIPFPPTKEEQSRIASALFDIDTLIRDLDRTIEKKQNIRQGAMEQLLSGKSDWVECELSEIINVVKGVQLNGSELLEDGPYPMINGGIEPSGYTTNFNRNAETITISEGGNSCGYVNFIHQKFWAGGHCYCVVIRKNVEIEKDFLYHLLKNNEKAIMAMRVGSGLPNVQSKTLLAMRVSYPADIKEQRAIADSLTAMDDEIAMLQLERTKYANIRSGMMDDLLSGTKRL